MTMRTRRHAPSRRRVLEEIALFGGGVALLTGPAQAADAKVSPSTVGYQTSPKGDAKCSTCTNFQSPSACKLVSGSISPEGWCSLYAKKS